jgi:septation ring formation regulator EzrA
MAWLKLENARKNKEAHEAKLAEVKANYELSDFEKYRLRDIQENLTRLETQLQKPVRRNTTRVESSEQKCS